jgi:predicted ATPase
LCRLAPRTSDLLELAATAGAEFELGVVQRAAGLDEAELLAAFDEAVRSGMIEELPGPGLVGRFTHVLARRALYGRLSGIRRAELHLRVAEALEVGGPRSGRALADLAHHFVAAAPFGGAARAVEAPPATAAARRAAVWRMR